MTHAFEISDAIDKYMRTGRSYHLDQLYSFVECECSLDREDFDPQAPGSSIPKWKRDVRNVLQRRKARDIRWLGGGMYQRI